MASEIRKIAGLCLLVSALFLDSAAKTEAESYEEGSFLKGHQKVSKGVPIPKGLPGVWADIHEMRRKLDEVLEDGKLTSAHNILFGIRDHARVMPKKSSRLLSGAKLDILKEQIKKIVDLTGMLDEACEEGNARAVTPLVQELDGVLEEIGGLYPVEALIAEGTYVCPWESEVRSAIPGKCPKCGADFVVRK